MNLGLTIGTLTIRNFFSIGALTQAIDLSLPGMTLILGENFDMPSGKSRNGTGKSTISQALHYAFFGKPINRITMGNMINDLNGSEMLVTVDFERDGRKYRIERGRKPDVLRLFVDGDERVNKAKGENSSTGDEIERIIGMSSTMFKHIICLNTYVDSFHKMGSADQKAIIEELLGITQLTERAVELKKLLDATKAAAILEKSRLDADIGANARIESAVRDIELKSVQWGEDQAAKLSQLEANLRRLSEIDFDKEITTLNEIIAFDKLLEDIERQYTEGERRKTDIGNQLLRAENSLVQFDQMVGRPFDSTDMDRDIARKEDMATAANERANTHYAEILRLTNQQSEPHDQCDTCGQDVIDPLHMENVAKKLAEQIENLTAKRDTEIELAKTIMDERTLLINGIETRRLEYAAEMEAMAGQRVQLTDEIDRLTKESNDLLNNDLTDVIIALGDRPNSRYTDMNHLYREKQHRDNTAKDLEVAIGEQNPFRGQMDVMRQTIKDISFVEFDKLQSTQQHQEYLHKLLAHKDSFIRRDMINRSLYALNERMAHYLDKLGLPHVVAFESDMSVEINLMGRPRDYDQMSRGEAARINLATSWSFRDVWEGNNTPVNLMWVDEMIDNGMCQFGAESSLAAMKAMIRDMGKNVFLISHRDELRGKIDQTMWVRKMGGFTSFEME